MAKRRGIKRNSCVLVLENIPACRFQRSRGGWSAAAPCSAVYWIHGSVASSPKGRKTEKAVPLAPVTLRAPDAHAPLCRSINWATTHRAQSRPVSAFVVKNGSKMRPRRGPVDASPGVANVTRIPALADPASPAKASYAPEAAHSVLHGFDRIGDQIGKDLLGLA